MKLFLSCVLLAAGLLLIGVAAPGGVPNGANPELGLPPVPIPQDNPQTADKIALGKKLFEDKRFSSTGEVSCATCHDEKKAFTDGPLQVGASVRSTACMTKREELTSAAVS